MSDDDSRPLSNRPAHLLNELESIKGVLTDEHVADTELPTDIPLLDDMVIDHLDDNANLLDIEQIFEDATDEAPVAAEPLVQFPRFKLDVLISDDHEIADAATPEATPPTSARSASTPPIRVRPDYSREVLIQELVDEFIPQIEVELHKRLQQLDDTALQRLKDSK